MAVAMALEEEQGRRVNKRNHNLRKNQGKLLFGAKVEVRSKEEGFQGSWHPGTVTACTKGCRKVEYDHILCDDESANLVDAVYVSPILDGIDSVTDEQSNYHRGSIRPKPPKIEVGAWGLPYGICVDVYHQDAWWEGVVFDHEDGLEKRKIFFPDLGDELTTGIDTLRITQDWDEVTENWQRRGTWIFLELIEQYEQERYIAVSVKQVWYDVRLKEGFEKVRQWTSPMRYLWEELVLEVIDDNLSITADELFQVLEVSGCLSRGFQVEFESAQCVLDADMNSKSYTTHSLAIVPVGNTLDSNLLVDHDDFMKNVLDCRAGIADEQSEGLSIIERTSRQNFNGTSSAKSDISSDGICVTKSKGRRTANWLPVELHKESCPSAVDKYLGKGRLPSGELQTAVRKHLLYLGWKVEYMIDKGRMRYRYLSPDGEPEYSLIKVCSNLRKSSKDSQFAISQDAPQCLHGSPGQLLVTEEPQEIQHPNYCPQQVASPFSNSKLHPEVFIYKPEYCPQAVVAYVDSPIRGPRSLRVKTMRSKAKKHLSAVGWEFYYSEIRSSNSLRFKSPKGNVYNSLLDACKVCMDEENSERRPAECRYVIDEDEAHLIKKKIFSVANRKCKRNRIRSLLNSGPHLLHECPKDQCANPPKLKRRKASASSSGFRNGSGVSQPTRVLRSSKRVQEVVTPTSTHQNPRTVLSWLIDNNVVLPREKVHYCSRKGGPSMAEGKISREGIKCSCCQKVFTLSCFESHAGFNETHAGCSNHRPASNIFLDDGRSLLDCQMQIILERRKRTCRTEPRHRMKGNRVRGESDYICTVCHYGGDLILCDECPSSFHKSCVGLKDVPDGEWFCPSCCCGLCGQRKLKEDKEPIMHSDFLTCGQCEHKYHTGCLRKGGVDMSESDSKGNWFCSKNCKKISLGLHKLLGKQFPAGVGNLTWSLLKSMKSDSDDATEPDNDAITESFSRLSIALDVMHECFEPVKEPLTRRDLAEDIIFSRGSNLNRLNFQGFYTVLLERNDELITVATVRIYGKKVAEVPLVATRFQYRRLGMCRVLMNLLEKMLMDLGVERLVLPAVPSVLNTWTTAFGFSRMTESERLQFLDHTFLDFQDTIMCQKLLMKISPAEPSLLKGTQPNISGSGDNIDLDGSSSVSEVCQLEKTEDSQTVFQGLESAAGKRRACVDKNCPEFKQYKRMRKSNLAAIVI
ncbi:uncharacterized protein LOC133733544 [Rosa rugosa]|uniref:uncharacterized protein LOC133733544 n=1 Tax=Rosa rugosa TaxID=74645 RepID=UPI002B40A3BC|nr:uncharacterized protein LOC133733544 [Rosa rugosa]